MSESLTHVRETARALGISIPEDRLETVAHAWAEALAEAEQVRGETTPWPTPSTYDASWSDKR